MDNTLLDIEPEEEPAPRLALVEDYQPEPTQPVEQVLPAGFNLRALLTFLPDIRLKQKLDADAEAALAIDITVPAGLQAVDAALPNLRAQAAHIAECFEEPTSLANQLHKRMTGLRADFLKRGNEAVETLGLRLVREKRRRDAIAAEEQRKLQAKADE